MPSSKKLNTTKKTNQLISEPERITLVVPIAKYQAKIRELETKLYNAEEKQKNQERVIQQQKEEIKDYKEVLSQVKIELETFNEKVESTEKQLTEFIPYCCKTCKVISGEPEESFVKCYSCEKPFCMDLHDENRPCGHHLQCSYGYFEFCDSCFIPKEIRSKYYEQPNGRCIITLKPELKDEFILNLFKKYPNVSDDLQNALIVLHHRD